MNPSPLSILPAPPCPLGHGPLGLITSAPSPMFHGRDTEHWRCPKCSVEIFRPVPNHEL